ncbi:MAG: 13E12 repeat family protein, partial [Actinomycetota bacterium]|nr:13E12 repeat family protein [Actinomycetota bacterium]
MLHRFDAEQDDLLTAAGRQPLSVFGRTVTRLVEGLHADAGADPNERLHHRRSLRRWWDDDGMRHWHLSIDAEAAARIDGALDAHVEALFHRDRNDGDTHRTSDQLACDALGDLVAGGHAATRPGRAEISVIVDHDTLVNGLHDRSIHVDNNGQPITPETIRRLACDADILPIVLAGTPCHWTWDARSAPPPMNNASPSPPSTPDARSATARCRSLTPKSTTPSNGTTTATPTSSSSCPSAGPTTTSSTTDHWHMTLDPDRLLHLWRPDGTNDSTHPPPGLAP